MGLLKNSVMIEQERGYYSIEDKQICLNCFGNKSLQSYIRKHATTKKCDYCKQKYSENVCININQVIMKINQSLNNYYIDPTNLLIGSDRDSWDSVLDAYDMFRSDEAELECENDEVIDDIIESFRDRQWFRENIYFPTRSEALKMSWDYFSSNVKERWRFTFFFDGPDPNEPSTFDAKKTFDNICRILESEYILKTLATGTEFYRVRKHSEDIAINRAEQIGTPKPEFVKTPNRLSPINIPMFYGSLNKDVAIEESKGSSSDDTTTVALFKNNVPIKVIDLSKPLAIPGYYSDDNIYIEPIKFINTFSRLISKPINDDENEYLEYLPTQVFTEYIRHLAFKDVVKGIIYGSSKIPGGINIALFYKNDECKDSNTVDPGEDCLVLTKLMTV